MPLPPPARSWVQEMYAYSIASATTLDKPISYKLHVEMQLQPPWDAKLTAEASAPAAPAAPALAFRELLLCLVGQGGPRMPAALR